MSKIIRVFPRRTSLTPTDAYAAIGDPPLFMPAGSEKYEVHVSCAFTWDIERAKRLAQAWGQYYPVKLGGPAFEDPCNDFVPGMYLRQGVTFTSRGCNFECPWCLVPKREGSLRQIDNFASGNIIQDNNFLQCNSSHADKVYQMLRSQKRVEFTGGLDARLLKWTDVEQLRSLNLYQLFFACDTKESLRFLRKAGELLRGRDRRKLRCYVLLAFNGQTPSEAQEHLENVWEAGFMPFAQLYQPPDHWIEYSLVWRHLQRTWCRPAAMQSIHKKANR